MSKHETCDHVALTGNARKALAHQDRRAEEMQLDAESVFTDVLGIAIASVICGIVAVIFAPIGTLYGMSNWIPFSCGAGLSAFILVFEQIRAHMAFVKLPRLNETLERMYVITGEVVCNYEKLDDLWLDTQEALGITEEKDQLWLDEFNDLGRVVVIWNLAQQVRSDKTRWLQAIKEIEQIMQDELAPLAARLKNEREQAERITEETAQEARDHFDLLVGKPPSQKTR